MFKSAIAYNNLVKELTITPHITAPDDLTPGEYWVGSLEVLFPEAYDYFSPHHLILEALDEAAEKTGTDVQGATITHGNHTLEFLSASVAYANRFTVNSDNEKLVSISGKNEFTAHRYIMFASMSDLRTYGKTIIDLKDGVNVSVHESITPSTSQNWMHFTYFTGEERIGVFDVFQSNFKA